jgi:pimeloyl-ACP methyl ester carboxylesterase
MSKSLDETVVLVHGLYTRGLIMAPLARWLRKAGYRTVVFSYPSVRRGPADNARELARCIAGLETDTVHLLAHSLGGLVVRHLFAGTPGLPPGRVVTLGTPHQGSLVARSLCDHKLGFLLGHSVEQGLLDHVSPWTGERQLGSIAGSVNMGMGRLVARVPDPADGAVRVAETYLPGMTDHVVMGVSHTAMLFSSAVAEQVCAFFATGRFLRGR